MARVASLAAEVTADIGPLKAQMSAAGNSVRDFTNKARTHSRQFDSSMQTATKSSGAFGRGIQNAAFQVGDFAVQVGGGTSAIRAMSMQLPQLLGGFGVMGAVAGATVAILGPLVQHLFSGAEAANEAENAISGLSGSLGSMRGDIKTLGDLQERLNDLHRAQAGASASGATAVIANTQKEYDARRQLIEVEQTLLRLRSQDAQAALRNLRDQQEMARQAAMDQLRTLGPGATASRGEGSGGFAGGGLRMDDITGSLNQDAMNQMEQRRIQIQRLEAELQLVEIAAQEADAALNGVFTGDSDVVGADTGGGGSATSRRVQQVKDEIEDLTQTSRDQLNEQLGHWGDFFGSMSSIMQGGNSRLLKIAKAFGAAQALISAYQGAAEALKLPFPENMAAYAQVLATGLGAVNAIKGASAGGGRGAGAAAAAPPPQPLQATLNLTGPFSEALQGVLDPLLDGLNQAAGDRGYKLLTVRS